MLKSETKSKILFQLSGSIACFKACALLSKLVQAGYDVEVVATSSALKFVGEATLEGLTGKPVHKDTFEAGRYMDHIHLMRWADLILLCPASANSINKLSQGIGDDLLSTLFLAHDFKKPYLIAPALNQLMFSHPATQSSISKLQSWGIEVLGTGVGNLACGEVGEGRMLEPEQIQVGIEQALSAPRTKNGNGRQILITAGGTEEPIDGVRSITNTSTGRTGSELATWFANHGDQVTLLHAKSAMTPTAETSIRKIMFTSFETLKKCLEETLSNDSYDAVIHLAAVADYSVSSVASNGAVYSAPLKDKIDSGEELTLTLKRNPKLIDSIRHSSKNPRLKIVGFKLTSTNNEKIRSEAVASLAKHSNADFIVHNDATEITATNHKFKIYKANGNTTSPEPVREVIGAENLALAIDPLLSHSGARS